MNYNVMNYSEYDINRFWNNVQVEYLNDGSPNFDVCMLWIGRKASIDKPYGIFWFNGKTIRSHRFVYECFNGSIPDGLLVCHKCDIPSCVNPYHLWLGTYLDNNHDRMIKDRGSKGSDHGNSALMDEDILKIITLFSQYDNRYIAKLFNVGPCTIRNIRMGKTWTHITNIKYNPNVSRRDKLTEEDIFNIHEDLFNGMKHQDLAVKYGVVQSTISKIKNNKIWKI